MAPTSTSNAASGEWLAALLDGLWPHINAATQAFATDNLPAILAANKPSWISDIRVNRLQLGNETPQIRNFKVVNSKDPLPETRLDFDFQWYSQQDIECTLELLPARLPYVPSFLSKHVHKMSTFSFGIERLELDVRMRLILRPLLDLLPVVQAVQVSFLEEPHLSFKLMSGEGEKEQEALTPSLQSWLQKLLTSSQLLGAYMYPDHFIYKLQPGAPDLYSFDGVLKVTLDKATDVPDMDHLSKTDGYAWMFLRPKLPQKSTVKDGRNPKWGEEFTFVVMDAALQALTVVLYDNDDLDTDDEIGRTSFSVHDLAPGTPTQLALRLLDVKEQTAAKDPHMTEEDRQLLKARRPCTVHLEATYMPFTPEERGELLQMQLHPQDYQPPKFIDEHSKVHWLLMEIKERLRNPEKPRPLNFG